jgi:hypothetical protein
MVLSGPEALGFAVCVLALFAGYLLAMRRRGYW